MEAAVRTGVGRLAFGIPHCKVCPLFLDQSVPVVATARGYALFCEVCELGHGPPTVRARDARALNLRVDEPPQEAETEEE